MTALLLTICLGADISGGAIPQPTYREIRARVEKGESLTLAVGFDSPGAIRCDEAKTHGVDVGLYSCWFDGTGPKMQRIVAPAPPAAKPIIVDRPVVNYIRNIGAAIVGQP